MKAILMAAGKGSRISKHIPEIPKCTLPVNGKPLIQKTVEMLIKNNIEVTIVVGYKYQHIIDALKEYKVNIVYNPFYDVTNSIASLWLAKEYLVDDDIILANADVFWSEEILNRLCAEDKEVFLFGDRNRVKDGDYFFGTQNGCVVKYGKELSVEERDCEYVGIAKVGRKFMDSFKKRLNEMIETQQHGVWWENVLYSYSSCENIYVVDVEGEFWAEIDFIEDYNRILDFVKNIEEK